MHLSPALIIISMTAILSPTCTVGAVSIPISYSNHSAIPKHTESSLREHPKSRFVRAAPKYPGCVITIDDIEAGALNSFLRGLMNTFTQKPQSVTSPSDGHDNEIRYTCDSGVSNVKTSVWLILNRIWLATTCQYPNEAAFQKALWEVYTEKKRLSRILTNVDVKISDGSILLNTYAVTVDELETTLENAIDSMIRTHDAKQCNSVNAKQVTDTLEAAVKEIISARKLAEIQKQQTENTFSILANFVTSQALANNPSNTAPILEFILQLPKDLARSVYKHVSPILLPSMISSVRAKDAYLPPALTNFAADPKISDLASAFIESLIIQAYDNNATNFEAVSQFIEKLPSPLQKSASKLLPPLSTIWPPLIRNGSIDSILSITNQPSSVITSTEIQSIVKDAWGSDVKNKDSVLKFIEKLPPALAVPALESVSSALLPTWSTNIQNGADTADVLRCAANPTTIPFLLNHISSLVSPAINTMSNVLHFIEALPAQTLAIKAYESFFSNSVHPPQDPIRLLFHLNNNLANGGRPFLAHFFNTKVHPGYVKLVTGDFFNLEGYTHRGEYLYIYTNPTDNTADIHSHGRGQGADSETRKQDQWLWKFVPVPGQDGKEVFLRNKLNKDKPVPPRNVAHVWHSFVKLEPVTPILLPASTGLENPKEIIIFMRAYNADGFYSYWLAYDQVDGGRRPWLPDTKLYASLDSGLDSKKWVLTFP